MLINNFKIGQYVRHCISYKRHSTHNEPYLDREKIVNAMRRLRDTYEEEIKQLRQENQELKGKLTLYDAPISRI